MKTKIIKNHTAIILFTLLFLLNIKYFIENWNGIGEESAYVLSKIILFLTVLLWCPLALYYAGFKQRIAFLILLVFFLYCFLVQGDKNLFWTLTSYPIFIFISRLSLKTAFGVVLSSALSGWLVMLPFLLLFSNSLYFHDDRYIRLTLGLNNPNTLAVLIFVLYSAILLCINEVSERNKQFVYYFFTTLILSPIILLTYSRTLIFLFFILLFYFPFREVRMFKISKLTNIFIFTTVAIAQFYLVIAFYNNNGLAFILDKFLSGRIWYSYLLLRDTGVPGLITGMDISNYLPIDFFFVNLVYSSGVLFFIIFSLFYITLLCHLKNDNSFLSIVCFTMIILSFSESVFNIPVVNFTMAILYCSFKNTIRSRELN